MFSFIYTCQTRMFEMNRLVPAKDLIELIQLD